MIASSRAGSRSKYGTRLATLRDATNLFAERFATVKRWRVLEIAIERLINAAESGKRDNVKAATDAIERVLRGAAHTGAPRRALTCGAGAVA